MSGRSKGAQRRTRKRRENATKHEVKAFAHGVEVAREVIGPEIWKRAAIRSGSIGFGVGLCTGGALVHYLV